MHLPSVQLVVVEEGIHLVGGDRNRLHLRLDWQPVWKQAVLIAQKELSKIFLYHSWISRIFRLMRGMAGQQKTNSNITYAHVESNKKGNFDMGKAGK